MKLLTFLVVCFVAFFQVEHFVRAKNIIVGGDQECTCTCGCKALNHGPQYRGPQNREPSNRMVPRHMLKNGKEEDRVIVLGAQNRNFCQRLKDKVVKTVTNVGQACAACCCPCLDADVPKKSIAI